ncbi:tRNA (guanosine(37)-N1)-methyltransferase TrmD [Alkalibacter mobilis]|uniref:tRNA (guanosine(37)-N1)-methyltransferase TrmD n=1 Tax=Alkalibacter mobilis TaxID=2787712 RepID=UPI00189CD7EF|nr:tRNA (guanosine(37)-N1)-methyltransferase TrmD [Alkalibacter mobilis]MBF7095828.1 tRNA (guanosine(37)-N1)-methyltransferase TrmD [Alkalibacter mobilis]
MKFFILTVFPEFFKNFISESIIGKAVSKGLVEIEVVNIRDFTLDKHNKTDDYPFGGGPGMVMTPQPLADAIKYSLGKANSGKVIYLTPKGKIYDQELAAGLSKAGEDLILVCGHYEGIDQRIIDKYVDFEISIGDFILTGGEIPAMVMIDSITRLLEGVLGNEESSESESFYDHLLEHPQYTRPREFEGMKVPEVLLSGNHKEIEKWRLEASINETKEKRPDLIKKYMSKKQ